MAIKEIKKEAVKEVVKEVAKETVSGIKEEKYNQVKAIILSGFKANQTPDAIKSAIFRTGVPFSKLSKLYTIITREEKLVEDPKVVADSLKKELAAVKLTLKETYGELSDIADKISLKVKGASSSKIISIFKGMFKENEVEFPRRPAPTRGKMGIINKTLIDVFKTNSKATEKDCENALVKVTKTPKNANDYAKQYHKMCYALANKLSSLEVLTVFSADNK